MNGWTTDGRLIDSQCRLKFPRSPCVSMSSTLKSGLTEPGPFDRTVHGNGKAGNSVCNSLSKYAAGAVDTPHSCASLTVPLSNPENQAAIPALPTARRSATTPAIEAGNAIGAKLGKAERPHRQPLFLARNSQIRLPTAESCMNSVPDIRT